MDVLCIVKFTADPTSIPGKFSIFNNFDVVLSTTTGQDV